MSFILGKLIIRYGEKAVTVAASIMIVIGMSLLPSLKVASPITLVLLYGFVIGIGFGAISAARTITVQDSVDYKKRGTAVAANTLLRTLGQTIGISIFGNIFNLGITRYFTAQAVMGVNPTDLYQSASGSALDAAQVRLSLNSALHTLFIIFIAIAGLSLLLSLLIPKIKPKYGASANQNEPA